MSCSGSGTSCWSDFPDNLGGSAVIDKEVRWLPQIWTAAASLRTRDCRNRRTGHGLYRAWSVVRWIDGDVPTVVDLRSKSTAARWSLALDLAAVVNALHAVVVPPGALADPWLRFGGPGL